jgi:hypothetical protein
VYTEEYSNIRRNITWVVSVLHIMIFILINYTNQLV